MEKMRKFHVHTVKEHIDWDGLRAEILSEKASGKGEIAGWSSGGNFVRNRTISSVYSRALGVPIGCITPLLAMEIKSSQHKAQIGSSVFLDINAAEKVVKAYHERKVKWHKAKIARELAALKVPSEVGAVDISVKPPEAVEHCDLPPFSLFNNMKEYPFPGTTIPVTIPINEKLDRIIGLLERLVAAWEK